MHRQLFCNSPHAYGNIKNNSINSNVKKVLSLPIINGIYISVGFSLFVPQKIQVICMESFLQNLSLQIASEMQQENSWESPGYHS